MGKKNKNHPKCKKIEEITKKLKYLIYNDEK
jgi:hypothetical protein